MDKAPDLTHLWGSRSTGDQLMTQARGPQDDEARRREAERIIARAGQDSPPVLGSSFARAADFMAARDGSTDPAEIWGKRIGRALSILVGIGCVIYIGFAYFS